MDPDANLREQRELASRISEDRSEGHGYTAHRLADLVLALDEWIKGGGFLPRDWQK